jgi:hypothetical protein
VEARQAGIRGQLRERDVRITVRTQAFDRAKQRLRRQPARDGPDRVSWVRSREVARRWSVAAEQRIQVLIAPRTSTALKSNRCNRSGCAVPPGDRSWRCRFVGNALEPCVRKMSRTTSTGFGISHPELDPSGMIITTPGRFQPQPTSCPPPMRCIEPL